MAFKMKGGLEGPMRKNFGDKYSPMNKALVGDQHKLPEHLKAKIEASPMNKKTDPPPATRRDSINAAAFQTMNVHNLPRDFPHKLYYDMEKSSKKVGELTKEEIAKLNAEVKKDISEGKNPFKMNGTQDKKVPAIPTKPEEGSDAWRTNFLKRHKVTNDQVNNEIYKIGGGEDDVDFDDWKRVVLSLSKNKKAHQADWEPRFMGGDN
jgi:hypothetical protein